VEPSVTKLGVTACGPVEVDERGVIRVPNQ
jgi:hypothetical protein